MDDLIKIEEIDGEGRVDSRYIACRLGNEHKHALEMIRKYKDRFERYGEVPFKTAPSLNPDSYQRVTVCWLNEKQATFLVTLSRNSEKAVDLKQDLNDAFHSYRSQFKTFQLPQTHHGALRLLAETANKLADQVEENSQLKTKIQEDQPKVEFVNRISRSKDTVSVGDFANILANKGVDKIDIGQNRLFDILKDKNGLNLLITAYKPYQYAIDNGWLIVDEYTFQDREGEERIGRRVMVTGKGQVYIEKKLREHLAEREAREVFFKKNKAS